ncbi:MAG: Rossmann-like domain-containing protein [Pelotomaculum sp.]
MNKNKVNTSTFFERLQKEFAAMVEEANLRQAEVEVKAALLSPEDAIGATKRTDYVLLAGKERLLQAKVMGAKGQAFTSAQGDFSGTLDDVLALSLEDDFQRAVYIATLNAVASHVGMVDNSIHCRNEGPELCAGQVADYFRKNYGHPRILMIGYQPALAEALNKAFPALTVLDLDPANIGKTKNGVLINDGAVGLDEHIANNDVIFSTGSTICNATIDTLYNASIPLVFYGTTASGAAALLGQARFCPEATCGK